MSLSFTSLEFFVFLGLCLILLRTIANPAGQKWLLIILSYLLYLSFGLVGVGVLTSIALVDFTVGRRLGKSSTAFARKRLLWISLSVNLGALVFFKYYVFLGETVASIVRPVGIHLPVPSGLLLPIGLSYFTFASMSYVLDIYYERLEPTQYFSDYIWYLVYFPKLVAGPIVRAVELLPQFKRGIQFSAEDFETGGAYLLVGAVKKLVIADQLSSHVGMILSAPEHYNAFTLVQGMLGYTVQIYADFSGYSDMAIGCARLMGIRFPQNFLMPYSSVNIAEFWRRWHVTLSSWFRDYVFLPLELGSRGIQNAEIRASRNIVTTMLLCGLWHGASWNFVLWGGLHGVALAIYQVYATRRSRKLRAASPSFPLLRMLASRVLTLSVVMFGWIFFGTPTLSIAFRYILRLVTWSSDGVALGSPYILPLTALVFLAHLLIGKNRNVVEELASLSMPARVFAYSSLLVLITSLVPSDTAPFVYLHF